jgi:hypothetical protein
MGSGEVVMMLGRNASATYIGRVPIRRHSSAAAGISLARSLERQGSRKLDWAVASSDRSEVEQNGCRRKHSNVFNNLDTDLPTGNDMCIHDLVPN